MPERPPLPVICGLLDEAARPGPGFRQAVCSRCTRQVSVNTRVAQSLSEADLVHELVCLLCWSDRDQGILRWYRDE